MSSTQFLSTLASRAVAAAVLLACMGAHAAVSTPSGQNAAGDLEGITYGPTGAGNVFQFQPFLFVQGLGNANSPSSVAALNSALSFEYSISGAGTNLMTVQYSITNKSASDSFSNLRFWVVANPDGDQTDFVDRLTETWGPQGALDPVARESQPFTFNPSDNIASRAIVNIGLTNGAPEAGCASSSGCDGVFALQWNAPTLAAGQRFVARVGLSDNGSTLSSRFLTATAVNSANTALTFSGTAQVQAVPEPSAVAMMLAGAGVIATALRRRRS